MKATIHQLTSSVSPDYFGKVDVSTDEDHSGAYQTIASYISDVLSGNTVIQAPRGGFNLSTGVLLDKDYSGMPGCRHVETEIMGQGDNIVFRVTFCEPELGMDSVADFMYRDVTRAETEAPFALRTAKELICTYASEYTIKQTPHMRLEEAMKLNPILYALTPALMQASMDERITAWKANGIIY